MKKIATHFSFLAIAIFGWQQGKAENKKNDIPVRINNIRKNLKEKATGNTRDQLKTVDFTGKILAQWGNWGNWGNWNNWPNWANWGNWRNF